MNLEHDTRCRVCHQKQEMLDYEKTVMPMIQNGSYINESTKKAKVVNVRFYCQNCGMNMSTPFRYEDEKFIPNFIADIQKSCVKFPAREYSDIK